MNDFPFMILLPTGGSGSDAFSRLSSLGNLYGGASTGSLASLGTQFGASQPGGGSASLVQPTAPAAPQGAGIPNSTASDASKNLLGAGLAQSSSLQQIRQGLFDKLQQTPMWSAIPQQARDVMQRGFLGNFGGST